MSCRWRKILIRSFYIKIKWIKIRYWSYPTDLKDESYFSPKKNSTIKILARDLWVKGFYLRHVDTISDGFSWRLEKPPGIVSTSIRYVTLYFRDRRSFAPSLNLAALPMNRRPIRYDFSSPLQNFDVVFPRKSGSFVIFFFISRSSSLSLFSPLSIAGLPPTFSFSLSFSFSIFQICGRDN